MRQTLDTETPTCVLSEQKAPGASAPEFQSRSSHHFIQSMCQPKSQPASLLTKTK